MTHLSMPEKFGLYDRKNDTDSCGVGFIVKVNGEKTHGILRDGLKILANLEHRGAAGSDPKAGDGAGITLQISHNFFSGVTSFELPDEGEYGIGMFFLPQEKHAVEKCRGIIDRYVKVEKLTVIGWRDVPTDNSGLSKNMLPREPVIKQVFIGSNNKNADEFERTLYIVRKQIEKEVAQSDLANKDFFYCASMSAYTVIYKGMFLAEQLKEYYADLRDERYHSALAMVHQRYSTNTFPSWGLAQPFRFIAHNGEINTIQGNVNWVNAREYELKSALLTAKGLEKIFPIITPNGSDTVYFDNMFELLYLAGRSLEHSICIMVPEAWEKNTYMNPALRAFYEYNTAMVEPWDGPAALAFTNGRQIGGALDRNGLRPLRYTETRDGYFLLASESGVLDFPVKDIVRKGKIKPGQMLLIDTEDGIVMFNNEIKENLSKQHDYQQWVNHNVIRLEDLPSPPVKKHPFHEEIRLSQAVFGYTYEEINIIIKHMADKQEEALLAMGTDTPLAVFSDKPKNLYSYFKQRFAQVTNPPIDSIREEIVMSLKSNVGGGGNILEDNPYNCHMLVIKQPILTNQDIERLRTNQNRDFRVEEIDICYNHREKNLCAGLEEMFERIVNAIDEGYKLIVLSDRNFSEEKIPIPSLLATAATHHYLIKNHKRGKVGIIVETGDAREVHHFAALIGYGAGAINPYLVMDSIDELRRYGSLRVVHKDDPVEDEPLPQKNYITAVNKGLKKIFAKMGISTLISYQGAQIFECVGIGKAVIDEYFTGTRTSLGGMGLDDIEAEMKQRHQLAFTSSTLKPTPKLETGGEYSWRVQGEKHSYTPEAVHYLQQSAWKNDRAMYDKFVKIIDLGGGQRFTVRNAFTFKYHRKTPIPIDDVEPVSEIVKRFSTGAMSIGAISKEAHEDLAIAMNRLGGKSNTGEGGEDEARFKKDADGNFKISRIKQVASGRFGVTSHYLVNADEIQIKIAQGAKPGEGGQLPGHKVDDYIAKLRHTIPGVTLISPPPHHDIYSIEDLAQLIFDLKNANTKADISVKLVSSYAVGTVAAGVAKAKADSITIAGYDGGTGASPASSIKHAGIPWEIGLADTQQTLVLNNLRGHIRIQVDGQLKTGRDVIIGAMLGADEFGFATTALIALGCIMMRKCHLNTCPVGIATQNSYLRSKYHGKPEYVENYFSMVAQEVREYMAKLGVRKFEDLIGSVEWLELDKTVNGRKFSRLDLGALLLKAPSASNTYRHTTPQNHHIDNVLDRRLIKDCYDSIHHKKKTRLALPIKNSNRTTGTMLSGEITRLCGSAGLPDDTIQIDFTGTAGQSFGAFLSRGVTLTLLGDGNDYVGKGLSGGKIIISPQERQIYTPEKNIIVGNTVLYGATSGRAFFCGLAGERFAVRNSGAVAVVEGTGDHCCEYMTGGTIVVLGDVGRNFGAGMNGGVAYIYDKNKTFRNKCNTTMVDIEQVRPSTSDKLKSLIEEHTKLTGSPKGKRILAGWRRMIRRFVVVIPLEYQKVLEAESEQRRIG